MTRTWRMHAGPRGESAEPLFETGCVALGWMAMGNLASIDPTAAAFQQHVAHAYPDRTVRSVAAAAGQLFRFVHEVAVGDLIATSFRGDRTVRLAKVAGAYAHDPTGAPSFPQRRPVTWVATIQRDQLSRPTRNTLGSAMSFFAVGPSAGFELTSLAGLPPIAPTEPVSPIDAGTEIAPEASATSPSSEALDGVTTHLRDG